MLMPPERAWLNRYNAEVEEKITPLLQEFNDERALNWLKKECREI